MYKKKINVNCFILIGGAMLVTWGISSILVSSVIHEKKNPWLISENPVFSFEEKILVNYRHFTIHVQNLLRRNRSTNFSLIVTSWMELTNTTYII